MSSCQQCGAENALDAQTCQMCGAALELRDSADDTQPTAPTIRPKKQRDSILAIVALFLGVLCLVPAPLFQLICIPLTWLCAIIAIVHINCSCRALRGGSRAGWGIAFSFIFPVLSLVFNPNVHWGHGEKAPQTQCTSNQRQIALAMLMYAQENEERLPGKTGLTPWSSDADKQRWRTKDIQDDTVVSIFDCKSSKLTGAPGQQAEYAMNADLMGVSLGAIPAPTYTLLTADVKGVDALFSANDIDLRHAGGFVASFVDGHIQYIKDLPHDPAPTTLQTADFTTLPPPVINKYIIQGTANFIEVQLSDWNSRPTCIAYSGKTMASSIGANGNSGVYLNVYYPGLPMSGKPRDITIGTFTNGYHGPSTNLVMPAAVGNSGDCVTYWLPPVTGNAQTVGSPAYTGYRMTCGDGKRVSIVPVVQ